MADQNEGFTSEGPPLRITTAVLAERAVMFAHPHHDPNDIHETVMSWDGREIGATELAQLAEWERRPILREPSRRIPAPVRAAVMARDGGACQECGSREHPSLDHVRPYSRGGRHTRANLRVLCRSCNSRKGAR
jgi:hypothetical protein